jgi:MFS transporter, FSR family, fosmidomycin resistance protein
MTQATDILPAGASQAKLVGGVCLAHMVSHYNMVLLAPLFVFIRADYGVSYTELGLALTVFSLVSTLLQTPVGFLVDRTDARLCLIGGLLLGSAAIAVAGLVDSFWVFLAMFGVLGLSNTVYHPSDYTLLSENVAPERLTQVFSYHTCAGMIGSAIAPVTLLFMQSLAGWRGAFIGASLFGATAALILMLSREQPSGPRAHAAKASVAAANPGPDGWRLLFSMPILLNLLFFLLLSMSSGGLNQFLVVGLAALHDTPLTLANTALTGLLTMSAVGVLVGGIVAGRTSHHGFVAASGLVVTAAMSIFVGLSDPGALLLVLVISLSGFASGMSFPSRDMIVRSVTPPGSFGKVFGFVTTGIHIGGIIAPIIFGQFLDHGAPRWVFFYIAACSIVAIATVVFSTGNRRTV